MFVKWGGKWYEIKCECIFIFFVRKILKVIMINLIIYFVSLTI